MGLIPPRRRDDQGGVAAHTVPAQRRERGWPIKANGQRRLHRSSPRLATLPSPPSPRYRIRFSRLTSRV